MSKYLKENVSIVVFERKTKSGLRHNIQTLTHDKIDELLEATYETRKWELENYPILLSTPTHSTWLNKSMNLEDVPAFFKENADLSGIFSYYNDTWSWSSEPFKKDIHLRYGTKLERE